VGLESGVRLGCSDAKKRWRCRGFIVVATGSSAPDGAGAGQGRHTSCLMKAWCIFFPACISGRREGRYNYSRCTWVTISDNLGVDAFIIGDNAR
jgi:hypothetical protein